MPRWICPYCELESNVIQLLVGHVESCPHCTKPSLVIDADADSIGKLRRETAIGAATAHELPNMWIVKLAVAIGAQGPLVFGATFFVVGTVAGYFMGFLILGATIVPLATTWVILEAMNDIHRCRRLLEELVRKRD